MVFININIYIYIFPQRVHWVDSVESTVRGLRREQDLVGIAEG